MQTWFYPVTATAAEKPEFEVPDESKPVSAIKA
jgi:hypothetical protein